MIRHTSAAIRMLVYGMPAEVAPPSRRNLLSYIEDLPRFGDREAYLWREGARWRRRTYAELHRRTLGCAAVLRRSGLRPGCAVLIRGPDGAPWREALLGTFRAGGAPIPLDPGTPDDLRFRIAAKVGEGLFIAPPGLAAPPGVPRIDLGSWSEENPAVAADPGPKDRAEIIFTS